MRKDCSSQKGDVDEEGIHCVPCLATIALHVRVGPASCAMLMNCHSSMNLVSKTIIDALNFPLIEHPESYELWWTDKFY